MFFLKYQFLYRQLIWNWEINAAFTYTRASQNYVRHTGHIRPAKNLNVARKLH